MSVRKLQRIASIAVICALVGMSSLAKADQPPADNFASLVKDWYTDTFRAHPLLASYAGFHDWDDKLDDVTAAGHEAEQKRLHGWLDKFEAFDASKLPLRDADDREVVIAKIKAALLEEEQIQSWRRDPGLYSTLVTEGVFQTIKRDYAPLPDRLRFAIARERRVPDILATAKTLIANPPPIFVDVALENIQGAIGFFETGVPAAFHSVDDTDLRKQLAVTNTAAIAALKDYETWLTGIRHMAHGDFALGAEKFSQKLLYEEMVDIPLKQLLAIGQAQLKKDQDAFIATARLIDPDAPPEKLVAAMEKDHPTADTLVSTARGQLTMLRKFIVGRQLTPLPPEEAPTVAATPEFERALIEAEMDPPGPYDANAKEAFYFVTPPDASLKPKEREAYLEGFNFSVLNNVSVHEVFPGHFVQLMLMRSLPGLSMVRRLDWANSNVEGWAHYCEQMTLDEGYGGNDPKMRLGQLMDALLRDSRYVVGIELHTGGMTLDQATRFFVREGHQTPSVARKEARRGTSDPTYLYYALGKLEILRLRADWQAKMGDRYEIGDFHRRLLDSGTVPIKLIRREMMGADGPLL